jgi:MFS family permease
MKEQVGFSSARVLLLQNGSLLGGLLSSYVWGWCADRYGSKSGLMSSLYLQALLPIFWLIMPREGPWSYSLAMAIAVLEGTARIGWQIASQHLLYINVVPPNRKMEYMAVYYAWVGLVGGLSQLVAGNVLDRAKALAGQFLGVSIDQYTVLFLAGLVLPVASILVFRLVRAGTAPTPTGSDA